MGGVNRLRGVGGTQQLQGLSVRLDGRGESSERSGRYTAATFIRMNRLRGVGDTQQLQGLSVRLDGRGESSERSGRYTAATRFINET